jgi:hypothetical protein
LLQPIYRSGVVYRQLSVVCPQSFTALLIAFLCCKLNACSCVDLYCFTH